MQRNPGCLPLHSSNPPTLHQGSLLKDWRRINVALTRARSKLILVGDIATLQEIPMFSRLVATVRAQNGLVVLPANAGETGS